MCGQGRAGLLRISLISVLLLAGSGSVHDATARNETRTLSFHHTHSGEDLTVTFKRDGRYDEAALARLNHFLRDWRNQDETVMDRHLFDILWEVYRDVDGKQPIQIVSAYRSPATNAMLHRRSSAVARYSQHMLGHAMDFYIPGVPLEQIRFAGLRMQRGGVGFYPTSGSPFVHLDTGNIRHWPRMTHDELARLFPDGRTVLIPSDGVPLKGYELAKADVEKRGNGDGVASVGKPSLLAALFKGNSASNGDEDDEGTTVSATNQRSAAPTAAPVATRVAKPANPPQPRPRPNSALQLASADAQIVQRAEPRPAPTADNSARVRSLTPADTTGDLRGSWNASAKPLEPTPAHLTPAQVAALKARQVLASVTNPPSAAGAPSSAYRAMAYAPVTTAPVDRPKVVAGSASVPGSARSESATPSPGSEPQNNNSVVKKGPHSNPATLANSTWLTAVMLAPSLSQSMSMTLMNNEIDVSGYFDKPQTVIAMGFTDNPMPNMLKVSFSGSATVKLETTSFAKRTAVPR